jgi:NitT/TauT family transport system substrate-binding protein
MRNAGPIERNVRTIMKRILLGACLALAANGALAGTPVTFVTDWKAQAEHGGFYQALAEGLYARRGLDVKIVQGGPSVNVPQLLAGGAAEFGIGSNGFIALNIVKAGAPIRAVMAVFQKDPQVLITHPRKDVTGLASMKDKPIMIADASTTAFWPWLRAKFGFRDSQIRKYTFNLAPFLVDPLAIQEGYVTSEPYTIEQQGHFKPQVYLLADNGYPGYANMVFATQKWIDTNPKAVQAFVDATAEGWLDYLYFDHQKADVLIKKDNPDMTDGLLSQARDKMRSYHLVQSAKNINPNCTGHCADVTPVGLMTDAQWKLFFDTMVKEKLYPATLPYKRAYDLRFINYNIQHHPPTL